MHLRSSTYVAPVEAVEAAAAEALEAAPPARGLYRALLETSSQ